MRNLKYFTFVQNNSGGFYIGPRAVIIQASTFKQANRIATLHGIRFGWANSDSCTCCGLRWDPQHDQADGTDTPQIHGTDVTNLRPGSETVRVVPHKAPAYDVANVSRYS
jgi:hypothetical protein